MDAAARKQAMHRIDQIVHDESLYIQWWTAPFFRLVYWDYIQFPENYLPRYAQSPIDYMTFWIDPQKKAALQRDMREGFLHVRQGKTGTKRRIELTGDLAQLVERIAARKAGYDVSPVRAVMDAYAARD